MRRIVFQGISMASTCSKELKENTLEFGTNPWFRSCSELNLFIVCDAGWSRRSTALKPEEKDEEGIYVGLRPVFIAKLAPTESWCLRNSGTYALVGAYA
jgi:hypothetical protein